jgi:hypothetical protein
MPEGFKPGLYEIGEVWELYVDGELKPVYVESITVYPKETDYEVTHYDDSGDVITELSLTEEDLESILRDRERDGL